jgi:hypothetical protein
MTVQDLLDDCNPQAEIRLAHNRSWPLAFQLGGMATDGEAIVWLVSGDHPVESPYAPSDLWAQVILWPTISRLLPHL